MDFAISSSKSWFTLLLVALLAIAPILAQDGFRDEDSFYDEDNYMDEDMGNWITSQGRGSTPRSAISDAWISAMLKFLKDNMDYEDYESNRSRIDEHVRQNWQEYCVGDYEKPNIIKRYDGRRIKIRVRIEEERLLRDMRNRFRKADEKMDGLWVAIVSDETKNPYQDTDPKAKDEMTDRDVMFDTVQNLLSKNVQVRDLRAITQLMQKEAQMLGLPAGASPEDYVARKDAQLQIMIYLWLTTRRIDRDPAMGVPVWYATVGCRMVHIQTAQELVRFQLSSGDTYVDSSSGDGDVRRSIKPVGVFGGLTERMARIQAIENVSKAVYSKMHRELRTRKTVLEENVYTVKFVGFSSSEERNIKYAMLDLKSGQRKYCDIETSSGGGAGYMEYRLKWRRPGHTQADVIDIIYGYCQDNQVRADSNKSTKGVIYFQPIGSFDD